MRNYGTVGMGDQRVRCTLTVHLAPHSPPDPAPSPTAANGPNQGDKTMLAEQLWGTPQAQNPYECPYLAGIC
jgi:hypothetical protein